MKKMQIGRMFKLLTDRNSPLSIKMQAFSVLNIYRKYVPATNRNIVAVSNRNFSSSYQLANTGQNKVEHVSGDVLKFYKLSENMIPRLPQLVEYLVSEKHSTKSVYKLLTSNSDLFNAELEHWKKCIENLNSCGFMSNQHVPIILEIPELCYNLEFDSLHNCISGLQAIGFSEGEIQHAISHHPKLIKQNPELLVKKYNWLGKFFSNKLLIQMLKTHTEILLSDVESMENKLMYINKRMGYSPGQIARCNFTAYSMNHIKTRHLFIERIGLFKKPEMKRGTLTANVKLRHIMESPKVEFVVDLCNMTVDEYDAFEQMVELGEGDEISDTEEHED